MMNLNLQNAKLISFQKHRFKCSIFLDGIFHNCYVASSSSLRKYLSEESVLPIDCLVYYSNNKYTLFAIKASGKYLIVNFSILNKIYADNIKSKNIILEKNIFNYKADIFDKENSVVYEIKAVMSNSNKSNYPDKTSKRIFKQLEDLKELSKFYKVCLVFIIVDPRVDEIEFSENLKSIISQFKQLNILYYYCFMDELKKVQLNKINIKHNLNN